MPRSNASSVKASSTPFFQSLELLEIVVLNDGARPCAIAKATAAARKRGMLPRDVFYGCGSLVTVAVVLGRFVRKSIREWRQL